MEGKSETGGRFEGTPKIPFTLGAQEERELTAEGLVWCFSQDKDIGEVGENIYVKGEGRTYEVSIEEKKAHTFDKYHPDPSADSGVNFQIRYLRTISG